MEKVDGMDLRAAFYCGSGQRANGRRQKADGRRQKAEGRGQKAER